MNERLVLLGSLGTALLASACCIGPLVLAALGIGSLGFAAALEPWRPWLLAITAGLLGLGFFLAYRPLQAHACGSDGKCLPVTSRRNLRNTLWVVAGLSGVLATYPSWSGAMKRTSPAPVVAAPDTAAVVLDVTGMTCEGCADKVEREIRRVSGVASVEVDFSSKRAVVRVKTPAPPVEELVSAVERAGYGALLAPRID